MFLTFDEGIFTVNLAIPCKHASHMAKFKNNMASRGCKLSMHLFVESMMLLEKTNKVGSYISFHISQSKSLMKKLPHYHDVYCKIRLLKVNSSCLRNHVAT